jgi:hypothetical protein
MVAEKFFHYINYTMKGELLLLFVILLLGLILCSFLGGYGCKEGMENNTSSQTFTGPNGATAQIQTDANGQTSLVITDSNGQTTTYTSNGSSTMYVGPNGGTAIVKNGVNGGSVIQVKDQNGDTVLTLTNNPNTGTSTATTQNGTYVNTNSDYDNYDHYSQSSYPVIFYGPNGGTARVIKTQNNNTIVITDSNGTTQIYYIDKNSDPSYAAYYGPNGGSAKVVSDNNGKKAVEVTTPDGTKILYYSNNVYVQNSQDSTINQYSPDTNSTGSDYNNAFSASTYYGPYGGQVNTVTGPAGNTVATYDSSAYTNSLPQGIPRSLIPPGQEDLYILKSEIVPPVCPACPAPIMQCPDKFDTTKCPPCEPCGRCAEPAFECKKVPNYGAFNQDFMPVPVLSDFSSFGM